MTGLETYLIGGGAVFIVWLLTILKAVLWGASRERDKQKAKEAEARANEIDRIKRAAGAAPVGMPDDEYNRDRKS